jgi:hypothetical protein
MYVQNSLGDKIEGCTPYTQGSAQISAAVPYAQGSSLSDAVALTLFTANMVDVPDNGYSANSFGQASFFNNTFSITGGSGPVDVTFSVMVNLTQSLFTGGKGIDALSNAYYILALNGHGFIVDFWSNEIGVNSSWSNSFSGTLSDTITLNFDQTYSLVSVVNSDLGVSQLPEPTTGSLMLLGTGILGLTGTLRRKINL